MNIVLVKLLFLLFIVLYSGKLVRLNGLFYLILIILFWFKSGKVIIGVFLFKFNLIDVFLVLLLKNNI